MELEIKNGNGKRKEYYENGKLKFEGEYIDGIRDGKGKEYYIDGELEFEGEYLNGKKWNGKGYNKNDNREFEIKDGKGEIKEYDYNGKLIFEGEYKNGVRHGKGKEYDNNEIIKFFGEYFNGKRWNGEANNFRVKYGKKNTIKINISFKILIFVHEPVSPSLYFFLRKFYFFDYDILIILLIVCV